MCVRMYRALVKPGKCGLPHLQVPQQKLLLSKSIVLSQVRAVNESRLPLTDRIFANLFGSHFKKAANTSPPV